MNGKMLQWIVKSTKIICGIMIGMLIILNLAAVVMRRVFASPIMWCEEVSLLLFVWTISLTLIPMTESRRAVKLDFFIDMMPPAMKAATSVVVNFVSAVCLGTVTVLGVSLMMRSQYRFTAILRIPYAYLYLSMVVGMGVSAFLYICQIVQEVKALGKGGREK